MYASLTTFWGDLFFFRSTMPTFMWHSANPWARCSSPWNKSSLSSKVSTSKSKLKIFPKTWFPSCIYKSIIIFLINSVSKSFGVTFESLFTSHNQCDCLFCCPILGLFERARMVLVITPGKQVSQAKRGVWAPYSSCINDQVLSSPPLRYLSPPCSLFHFNYVSSTNSSDPTGIPTFKPPPHSCRALLPLWPSQSTAMTSRKSYNGAIVYVVEFRLLEPAFRYDRDFAPLCFPALYSTTPPVPQCALRFPAPPRPCSALLRQFPLLPYLCQT